MISLNWMQNAYEFYVKTQKKKNIYQRKRQDKKKAHTHSTAQTEKEQTSKTNHDFLQTKAHNKRVQHTVEKPGVLSRKREEKTKIYIYIYRWLQNEK